MKPVLETKVFKDVRVLKGKDDKGHDVFHVKPNRLDDLELHIIESFLSTISIDEGTERQHVADQFRGHASEVAWRLGIRLTFDPDYASEVEWAVACREIYLREWRVGRQPEYYDYSNRWQSIHIVDASSLESTPEGE